MNRLRFATVLGVDVSIIESIETSTRDVSDSLIEKVCERLNVNKQWLLFGIGHLSNLKPNEGYSAISKEIVDYIKKKPSMSIKDIELTIESMKYRYCLKFSNEKKYETFKNKITAKVRR
ncbi:MAG: hypothetical protein RSC84_02670 [Peptostreptococcaceae bacterium]